jgi:VanZ family protein
MTLRKLSTIGLTLTWVFAYTATHIPAERIPDLHTSDKTLHMVGYFMLVTAWLVTLRFRNTPFPRRLLLTLAIFPLYALFDETTQPLVNRFFGWGDILADLVGMSAALAIDAIATWFCQRNVSDN